MKKTQNNQLLYEQALYWMVFIFALSIRLYKLGDSPLSDYESKLALQSWNITLGKGVGSLASPGYIMLSSLLMVVFGASDAIARMLPALAGSFIIWLPFFFKRWFKPVPALILALGLALDPAFVSLSRLAGGPVLGVFFGLAAFALWQQKKAHVAGICLGLGFLSGASFITGAAGLAITVGVYCILGHQSASQERGQMDDKKIDRKEVVVVVSNAVLTAVLVSTLFLKVPQGLSSIISPLWEFIKGWVTPSGDPWQRLLGILFVTQPLVIILGLVRMIRGFRTKEPIDQGLSIWFFVMSLMIVLYPSRQMMDLIWILLPLWSLAARECSHWISQRSIQPTWVDFTHAGLTIIILVFIWINLAGVNLPNQTPEVVHLRWVIIGGALVLGVISAVFVGASWSLQIALRGLVWGCGVVFICMLISNSWYSIHSSELNTQNVWVPQPNPVDVRVMAESIGDISEWHTGNRNGLDVVLLQDWPSIRWALRENSHVEVRSSVPGSQIPPVLITPENQELSALSAAYNGKDFVVRGSIEWSGALPDQPLNWILYKKAHIHEEKVILWARSDLFPDGG